VAVATQEGVLVNLHLGEARRLHIFRLADGRAELIEQREAPAPGLGQQRWVRLAEMLCDCRALLTASAGETPRKALEESGIRTVMMEGLIEEGLQAVYANTPLRAPLRAEHLCGSGCAGDGTGCG
jgi:nitrogen fixation protein NifB